MKAELSGGSSFLSIQSFNCKETEEFFFTDKTSTKCKWRSVHNVARRKLDMLEYAEKLDDLKSPPGNKLESLKGNLAGYYSIRVNDQWRCIFRWTLEGPSEVKIDDYH